MNNIPLISWLWLLLAFLCLARSVTLIPPLPAKPLPTEYYLVCYETITSAGGPVQGDIKVNFGGPLTNWRIDDVRELIKSYLKDNGTDTGSNKIIFRSFTRIQP